MRALLVLCLLLGGCGTLRHETLARCHGARRPANPNGSILAPPPDPAALAPAPPSTAPNPGCGVRP